MQNSRNARRLLSAIAALLVAASLCGTLSACSSDKNAGKSAQQPQSESSTVKETKPETTEPPQDNSTEAPVVTYVGYANADHICVYGTAPENSTVYLTGGKEDLSYDCADGIFCFDLTVSNSGKAVKIYAESEGKEPSKKRIVDINSSDTTDKQVIIGKNGSGALHYNATLYDYLRVNAWNQRDMQRRRERLEDIYDKIQEVSPRTKLIYFIAPNHSTIYPESMPEYLTPQNTKSKLEAFIEYMADSEKVTFISPNEYLLEKKDLGERLYQHTDTHWNELGAFYGVEYLLSFIAKDFPDVEKQLSLDDCTVSHVSYAGGDMLNYLGADLKKCREIAVCCRLNNPTSDLNYDKPFSMNFENAWTSDQRTTTKKSSDKLPTGLMYRDSFSTNMMSFLSECFSRMDYTAFIGYNVQIGTVRSVKPDYVIVECVERNMDSIN